MTFNRVTRRLLTRLQKADRPQVVDITESVHILAQAGLVEYEAYQTWPDMVLAWATPLTGEFDVKPACATVVVKKSTNDRVKAEAKEYLRNVTESINREQNAPRDMLITICQLDQLLDEAQRVSDLMTEEANSLHATVDQKDQEILTLRAELNRVHDEYTWLISRKQKPTKERTMAKFTISVDEITDDGLVVRGVQLSVDGVEVATVERIARKFVDSLGPYNATGAEVTGASPVHEHVCKCEASNGDKRPGTAATYHDRSTVDRREKERGTPDTSSAFAPEVD